MDANQFADATKGLTPQFDCSARQVSNGFLLAGTVRWINPQTQTIQMAQNFEAIDTSADSAAESVKNFLNTGKF